MSEDTPQNTGFLCYSCAVFVAGCNFISIAL
jgi:hypothetical protein